MMSIRGLVFLLAAAVLVAVSGSASAQPAKKSQTLPKEDQRIETIEV